MQRSRSPAYPWSKLTPEERELRDKNAQEREEARIAARRANEEKRFRQDQEKRWHKAKKAIETRVAQIEKEEYKINSAIMHGGLSKERLKSYLAALNDLAEQRQKQDDQERNLSNMKSDSVVEHFEEPDKPFKERPEPGSDPNGWQMRHGGQGFVVTGAPQEQDTDGAPHNSAFARASKPRHRKPMLRPTKTVQTRSKMTSGSPVSATYLRYRDTTTGRFVSMRTRY